MSPSPAPVLVICKIVPLLEIVLKFATRENGVGSQVIGLTITPDQKVGIGTTTPDQKLHVEFSNTDTSFSGGTGGAWGSEGIRIENTSSTNGTMAMLHLRNNDANDLK